MARITGGIFKPEVVEAARIEVADSDHTADFTTNTVVITSISAPRQIVLPVPAASNRGQTIHVQDESGDVSETNTVAVTVSGGGTIEGASSFVARVAYFSVSFQSTGTEYMISSVDDDLTGATGQAAYDNLGIWVGLEAPPSQVSYHQWLINQSGYWLWIEADSAPPHADITGVAGEVFVTGGVQLLTSLLLTDSESVEVIPGLSTWGISFGTSLTTIAASMNVTSGGSYAISKSLVGTAGVTFATGGTSTLAKGLLGVAGSTNVTAGTATQEVTTPAASPEVISTGTVTHVSVSPLVPGMPATFAADDILVALVQDKDGTVPSAPSGWTTKTSQTGATGTPQAAAVYWKRAAGGDSAPSFTVSGSGATGVITAVRGCPTAGDPFDVTGIATANTGPPTSIATSVTTSVGDTLLIMFGALGGYATDGDLGGTTSITVGSPSGPATTLLGSRNSGVISYPYSMAAYHGARSPSGSTGNCTVNWSDIGGYESGNVIGILVALKPA